MTIIDENIGNHLEFMSRTINRGEFENIVHLLNERHAGCDIHKITREYGKIVFEAGTINGPLPAVVKKFRMKSGMIIEDAAAQIYVNKRTWQRYESGETSMPIGLFELFLGKAGM